VKILITSVSAGSGHVRAAQAIEAAYKLEHPDIEALHVNVMDLVSKPFRRLYEDGYMLLADKAPAMWGWLYDATDRSGNHSGAQRAINAFQRNCSRPFLSFLENFSPDMIISTHFLVPQILSSGVMFPSIPMEVVITDYDLHRMWLSPLVRRYYVGHERVAETFSRYGLDSSRVTVSGIPIHPSFSEKISRDEVLQSLGFEPGVPTVLLMSGGLGFGSLEATLKRLLNIKSRLQIITVCGKNAEMLARVSTLQPPANIAVKNLGYVNNMHELLGVSDLAITKAGGLTTAECMAKGVPMVIVSALPGQEQKNADFVLSKQAGWQPNNLDQLVSVVVSLLNAPHELARLRMNARAAGAPMAAFTIASNALNAFCLAA
jgi:processive 1,2-diacylglycerol beta-glucosyltransferase